MAPPDLSITYKEYIIVFRNSVGGGRCRNFASARHLIESRALALRPLLCSPLGKPLIVTCAIWAL